MRLHPRSALLAAALIAPAAAFSTACGSSDKPAPAPGAAKLDTTDRAPAATRPVLASQMRQAVAAGSGGVIALVNDGHTVKLHAAGVADRRSGGQAA